MANTFIKATKVVQAANLLLQREIVLPRLFWTRPGEEFIGVKDDTVSLRIPGKVDATTRTLRASAALTPDDITETKVDVVLNKHIHSLLNITDEQLTLDISDFVTQILQPQLRSVAESFENLLATTLSGADAAATAIDFGGGGGGDLDARQMLVHARAVLNNLNVPKSERVLVAGNNVEAALLDTDLFVKTNESGTDSALREATLGRLFGFTIVGSNAIDPDTAYACHRTAIAFATVAPQVPAGAADGARTSTDGLAMRYVRDYNPTNSTGPVDRSLVDFFAGAASVEEGTPDAKNYRLVKVNYEGTGPITSS